MVDNERVQAYGNEEAPTQKLLDGVDARDTQHPSILRKQEGVRESKSLRRTESRRIFKSKTMRKCSFVLQTWNPYTQKWSSKNIFKTREEAEQWQFDDTVELPIELKPKYRIIEQ